LIGGANYNECCVNLYSVLEKLNYYNIKINLDKCRFFEKSVKFLGHIISSDGIKPCEHKIKAICNAPSPKNLKELQAYLGLLNYYGKFIPKLSIEIKELYELLKKENKFIWEKKHEWVFQKSKKLLLENNILTLYDPTKPLVVSCDGSPWGVAAVLSHEINGVERPILFISSTLSTTEQNYSQLHREGLAIIFALKKFHKYIYGNKFTLCSDNQALKEIFSPKKATSQISSSRLQRWALMLSMYNYEFKHRPAREMTHVDALSRLPLKEETGIKSFNFEPETPVNREVIKKHLENDVFLSKFLCYIKYGFPSDLQSTLHDENFKYFYKLRKDFSCEDNLLFYRDRIVIPNSLKHKIVKLLHNEHDGVVRMKLKCRMYFWWKNVDQDIENCVKQCFACQSCVNVPRKEITYQWEKTTYPFERIHLDFFYFKSSNFLLLVDSFSKFIEVWEMKKTDAYNVKNILRRFFSIFGLPDLVVADNGPPFNSSEFREFLHNNNIDYKNSPVYHPQSNGLAERAVQTIKNKLKKFCSDLKYKNLNTNQKLDLILFSYRNTPTTTTNKTPSELLFNYKQKTLLNSIIKKEKCKIIDSKNHSGELKNDNCTNGNQINKAINFSFLKRGKSALQVTLQRFCKMKTCYY
jgi:hypothetical protein